MTKKHKSRTILVKLLSTAGTGWFYITSRPRLSPKLSFIKFDPKEFYLRKLKSNDYSKKTTIYKSEQRFY
ncbi:hypothetical protein PORY_002283 [Pneumocystis oryctolagi]|uniref:Uncharacterized protein n=1 Tax=Pneumocystis oryctolagi TaxID=42067 RepID=A0ACB7CBJ1_9ASCO|nr:hypothetical protein PORY_002283 [Pneumocystis oryctolagi]